EIVAAAAFEEFRREGESIYHVHMSAGIRRTDQNAIVPPQLAPQGIGFRVLASHLRLKRGQQLVLENNVDHRVERSRTAFSSDIADQLSLDRLVLRGLHFKNVI